MPAKYESYWDFIEPAWDDLCTGLDKPGVWSALQQKYSHPIVSLFTSHFCQSEVCNGGWLQFFWNSTGVIGPEAVDGFEQIHMPLMAAIARQAVAKLGTPYPREREERWDALLAASTMDGDEMRAIFATEKSFFLAYRRATASLDLDSLDRQFFATIHTEGGGFEAAATAYANTTAEYHTVRRSHD